MSRKLVLASALVLCACSGKAKMAISAAPPPGNPDGTTPTLSGAQAMGVGFSGAHRLTRNEYANTLRDLLGDTTNPGFATLPEDASDPFDNDYTTQLASGALVDAVETLAIDVATRAVGSASAMAAVVPCTPTSPSDAVCFRAFITQFGRRALRRPLSEDEIQRYLGLQSLAVEAKDFNVGVRLVLQAMLQDLEFLYRVEIGLPVAGDPQLFRLTPFEVASRLSFFLWGTTPPDWLLDLAQGGSLSTSDQVRAAATRLLADPRARSRVERFHALWFGYTRLPHSPELNTAMTMESSALVDKVVFDDKADYFQLFESDKTYINDALAAQYGLPSPGSPAFAWVSYGASGRKGILSHGSVLAQGTKFGDTSPTRRGVFVRTRLFCQSVPPPPPTVNVDNPPPPSAGACKKDRYSAHANVGSCAGCHQNLDPIGFGLENYDQNGQYRATDVGAPGCAISGQGQVSGVGAFQGPAGLADLLTQKGILEPCVTTQVFRFAMGRRETPIDQNLLDRLTAGFTAKGRKFDQLLLDLTSEPMFLYRVEL